jgi:hypothetical protein
MYRHLLAAALLFAAPVFALAAAFPSQALFLSKSPVVEGETVLIHAVVANDAERTFEGAVHYRSGEEPLGSVPVKLAPGEARTVSLSWTPQEGSYTITAELRSGDTVAASKQAKFAVEAKPKPEEAAAASPGNTSVESSAPIQEVIAEASPAVAERSAPVFAAIDSARQRGAEFLDAQIAQTQKNLEDRAVLGAATNEEERAGSGTALKIFQTAYLYLLTLLRAILTTAFYFYPLLVVGFLYALWRLYRRMSAR